MVVEASYFMVTFMQPELDLLSRRKESWKLENTVDFKLKMKRNFITTMIQSIYPIQQKNGLIKRRSKILNDLARAQTAIQVKIYGVTWSRLYTEDALTTWWI